MLLQPNKRVIQALAALESDPDFKEVFNWVAASLNQIDRDCRLTKDEVQTRWLQGASQALEAFISKAIQARDTARKF